MIIEILIFILISVVIGSGIVLIINYLYLTEPKLNLNGHFKPHKHFFFEKCAKCGKKLKHYHWFWGKGDKMGCEVDYFGNTKWYCEKCDAEIWADCNYEEPHN